MANQQHLDLLRKGVDTWNKWRKKDEMPGDPGTEPDLRNANLYKAHLEGANLCGARLEGANLREAHLEGANLCGAHLECASLSYVHLEEAILTDAHLEKTNLNRAHLEGTIFTWASESYDVDDWFMVENSAHLEGANLYGARLDGTDMRGVHLEKAILCNTHLSGADFTEAHLEGANLRGAYFRRVNFRCASLEGADLRGADLSKNGVVLEGSNLSKAHLEGANLVGRDLKKAILCDAYLAGTDLSVSHLEGANLRGAHLEGATLSMTHLQEADFSGAYLEGADLLMAYLEGANFSGADLKKVKFSSLQCEDEGRRYYYTTSLERVSFSNTNLQEAHLESADLTNADLEGVNLEGAYLEQAKLRPTDLERANLQGAHLKDTGLIFPSPDLILEEGDEMSLDDAFQKSNIRAAKRVKRGHQVTILYLPDDKGVMMRRHYPPETLIEQETFPHLGALLDNAVKKGYTEVKRYTKDWRPLFDQSTDLLFTDDELLNLFGIKVDDDDEFTSKISSRDQAAIASEAGFLNERMNYNEYLDVLENGILDQWGMPLAIDVDIDSGGKYYLWP